MIRCLENGNDTTKICRCFKGRRSYWENWTYLTHAKDWRLFFPVSEEHNTVNMLQGFQKQTWDVGAGKGKTHQVVLNWWLCPTLVSTRALQAGSAGPVGDTTADLQGVHRHHLDPSYSFSLWMMHWGHTMGADAQCQCELDACFCQAEKFLTCICLWRKNFLFGLRFISFHPDHLPR